jgi:hypothetical protein
MKATVTVERRACHSRDIEVEVSPDVLAGLSRDQQATIFMRTAEDQASDHEFGSAGHDAHYAAIDVLFPEDVAYADMDSDEKSKLKMYILIVDDIDAGHTILGSAHAALACYLDFQDQPIVQDWAQYSFRKVVCKVNRDQLERAKKYPYHRVMTESAFGPGYEVGIAFAPRREWPKFFNFLPLYREFAPQDDRVKCGCCAKPIDAEHLGGVGDISERKFVCDNVICAQWLLDRTGGQ